MSRLAHLAACLLLAACSAAGRDVQRPDLKVILAETPPPVLSDYGLFADVASAVPAEGVMPYDLINPLFTDHAAKHRLIFVPEEKRRNLTTQMFLAFRSGRSL